MANDYSQQDYVKTEQDKKSSMTDVLMQIGEDISSLMSNSNAVCTNLTTLKEQTDENHSRMNTVDNIIADLLARLTGLENHLYRDK